MFKCFSALLAAAAIVSLAVADSRVVIVVDSTAPPLEQLAARELSTMLTRLFDSDVTLSKAEPDIQVPTIYLGSPSTNQSIQQIAGDSWPSLSEQGIVLRSRGAGDSLIVGGGSPVATLWAVYELGYQFGIRYLLSGDIDPDGSPPLDLSGLDLVQEPQFRLRGWQLLGSTAWSTGSWPLADLRGLVGQLAKMRFNRLLLDVQPWQPLVDYEFQGVQRKTASFWLRETYPVARDAPGRTAFGGLTKFRNPDFVGQPDYLATTKVGIRLVRGLIDEAQRLGMTVGISLSPLEFPREFTFALGGRAQAESSVDLLVGPGGGQSWDDRTLRDLVATKIRAYLTTYPDVDALYLRLPHAPDWNTNANEAWSQLVQRVGTRPSREDQLRAALPRAADGEQGEQAMWADIVSLAFLDRLFKDSKVVERADGRPVELVVTAVDPQLYPYLDRLLPRGTSALNTLADTARQMADHADYLSQVPSESVSNRLLVALSDERTGVLAQASNRKLAIPLATIGEREWDGFVATHTFPGEIDPEVHFMSRVAWDLSLTERGAHDELFTSITGRQTASDRLWLARGHMAEATELIEQHEPTFAELAPGMVIKHYRADPAPAWWTELTEHYTQSMIELYRSHSSAEPRGQPLLFYWAKRSEYVLEYLACVKALRDSAIAEGSGDGDVAIEQMEVALEQLYNAIDTLGDVARDQSDLGLIAALNAYAYQPLMAAYEQVIDGQ